MSNALKRISVADYLERERRAGSKSEFFEGEVFAMAGGSPAHSLIAACFIGEGYAIVASRSLPNFLQAIFE